MDEVELIQCGVTLMLMTFLYTFAHLDSCCCLLKEQFTQKKEMLSFTHTAVVPNPPDFLDLENKIFCRLSRLLFSFFMGKSTIKLLSCRSTLKLFKINDAFV